MRYNAVLGDAADFINGCAFKPADWDGKGKPIIRIQNLTNPDKPINYTTRVVAEKYHVSAGDLLVSWSATLGVFEWHGDDALLNQHIFKVVPNLEKADLKYLRYAIDAAIHQMARYTHGSTMKHINRAEFLKTPVYLPPLEEQRRIAAILDKADTVRKKRQQSLDMLDDFLRATFLDMFGDPATNPRNLEIGTIRDLLCEAKYGTSQKADLVEGEYPVLRMGNITYEGTLDVSDLKYLDLSERDIPKYTVQNGDLLFNRTNSKELVGKTTVFDLDKPYAFAGYLVRARVNEKADPYYISAFMNSKHGKTILQGMCKSIVGMANINAQEFQNIKIAIPPVEEQRRYGNIVCSVRQKQERMKVALDEANDLFASISQRAFEGDI